MIVIDKDYLTRITELVKITHYVERVLLEAHQLRGDKFPFKSPLLQSAYNEIRSARMFGMDCLRLLNMKDESRNNLVYEPTKEAQYNEPITEGVLYMQENILLSAMYVECRNITFSLFTRGKYFVRPSISQSSTKKTTTAQKLSVFDFYTEFSACKTMFLTAVKKAMQFIRLRQVEIMPVSEVKDNGVSGTTPKLVHIGMDALMTDIFNLAKDIVESNLALGDYENLTEVDRAIHDERIKFLYAIRSLTLKYL